MCGFFFVVSFGLWATNKRINKCLASTFSLGRRRANGIKCKQTAIQSFFFSLRTAHDNNISFIVVDVVGVVVDGPNVGLACYKPLLLLLLHTAEKCSWCFFCIFGLWARTRRNLGRHQTWKWSWTRSSFRMQTVLNMIKFKSSRSHLISFYARYTARTFFRCVHIICVDCHGLIKSKRFIVPCLSTCTLHLALHFWCLSIVLCSSTKRRCYRYTLDSNEVDRFNALTVFALLLICVISKCVISDWYRYVENRFTALTDVSTSQLCSKHKSSAGPRLRSQDDDRSSCFDSHTVRLWLWHGYVSDNTLLISLWRLHLLRTFFSPVSSSHLNYEWVPSDQPEQRNASSTQVDTTICSHTA